MTRSEIAAWAKLAPGLRETCDAPAELPRIPPKEAEGESVAVACRHCGATWRVLRYKSFRQWLDLHEAACAKRSPEERAFYVERRRWPEEGADVAKLSKMTRAMTGAERTARWKAKKRGKR